MKKSADVIRDLESYRKVFLDSAKKARKRYYLENRNFYKDMRFDEFLDCRSKLHLIEDILGFQETKVEIVIYN